jgi:hypothetical protein
MLVFAASVRALVTPVIRKTSISVHHALMVSHSRHVSTMSATSKLLLKGSRPGTRREPTGTHRLGHRVDLLLADVRKSERQEVSC